MNVLDTLIVASAVAGAAVLLWRRLTKPAVPSCHSQGPTTSAAAIGGDVVLKGALAAGISRVNKKRTHGAKSAAHERPPSTAHRVRA